MKRGLIVIMALIAVFALTFMPATHAADYDVALTTYPVTEATGIGALSANIAGNIKIDKIILSNQGATTQTVTLYEKADSTTTVTSRMTIELPASGRPETIDIPYYSEMRVTNFAVRKSTTATTVTIFVLYR